MKPRLIRASCLVLLLITAFSSSISHLLGAGSPAILLPTSLREDSVGISRAGGRSLLSLSDRETELAAKLDGTISLRRKNSRRVIWSLASGSPIYSSYQAPLSPDIDKENGTEPSTGFFIDCGEDWDLYAYGTDSGKMKLPMTVEEFVRHMPHVSESGAIMLGSKRTTVYVLDAVTGRLLRVYSSPDTPSILQSDKGESSFYYNDNSKNELVKSGSGSAVQQQFHITRTDYALWSFQPNSDKILWSLTVAEIGAALLCQTVNTPFVSATLSSSCKLDSEIVIDFDMPFPCQSKGFVIREQDQLTLLDDPVLPLPNSDMLDTEDKVDRSLGDHQNAKMLLLQPKTRKLSDVPVDSVRKTVLPLQGNNSTEGDVHDVRKPHGDVLSIFSERSTAFSLYLVIIILVGFLIYRHVSVAKELAALKEGQHGKSSVTSSKKKKTQRSVKNNGSFDKSENDDELLSNEGENKISLDLNKFVDGGIDGRRVGKLIVSNKEIAKGSNGTVVIEGFYEGRPVAVKRLVQAHHDVAFKEIQNLVASDQHPNIVRWYGVEYDHDFVYLALERCSCSLDDLIQIYSDTLRNQVIGKDQATRAMIEYKVRLDSVKGVMQDLKLWKANGRPSSLLLQLMRDVVSGLVHLHELGIIHRDIKPQNVLIVKEKLLRAKLSDMGISKRLLEDRSSLDHHATGCGSSGWQAPEQLLHGRQTRAVDMFTLGCVLFFCITGGRHPFGDSLERDINIVKNQMDLFLLECIPEAVNLISRLLNPDPELRPGALEVLHHPFFWSSETRLAFLRDTSDRVELEDRVANSDLLKALERTAPTALGGKWDEKMEPAFMSNIGHYRRYRFTSIRDLLRVMRNKLNHYGELPKEIQELVGPVPEGYDDYFTSRFPRLLIEVYEVVSRYCRKEECFQKYFTGNFD